LEIGTRFKEDCDTIIRCISHLFLPCPLEIGTRFKEDCDLTRDVAVCDGPCHACWKLGLASKRIATFSPCSTSSGWATDTVGNWDSLQRGLRRDLVPRQPPAVTLNVGNWDSLQRGLRPITDAKANLVAVTESWKLGLASKRIATLVPVNRPTTATATLEIGTRFKEDCDHRTLHRAGGAVRWKLGLASKRIATAGKLILSGFSPSPLEIGTRFKEDCDTCPQSHPTGSDMVGNWDSLQRGLRPTMLSPASLQPW